MKVIQKNQKTYLNILLIGLLFILGFPEFDYSFSTGIDPSLRFLFHHILSEGLGIGKEIIFPYGPLSFIMYPLFSDPWPAITARLFLHLIILLLCLRLYSPENIWEYFLFFAGGFILLWLNNFHGLLTVIIALFYLLALKERKFLFAGFGLIFSILSVYIKINAAVLAGTLSFSFFLILIFQRENLKKVLLLVLAAPVLMLILWVIMYGSPEGIFQYYSGLLHLAGGNGSGASLYPVNHPVLLTGFLAVFIIFPFTRPGKKALTFTLFFALSFFASWKHGMGRQDHQHFFVFFAFCSSMLILFFLNRTEVKIWKQLLLLTGLILLSASLKFSFPWARTFPIPRGPSNFMNFAVGFKGEKNRDEKTSFDQASINQLPDSVLSLIGDKSTDIYPWDYSYLAVNQLNWQPRPSIQAFLSYTGWIENQNIRHFNSDKAPEFLLWHISREQAEANPGRMYGIDNRYILNDEPLLIKEFLKNYESLYFGEQFTLYRKRKEMEVLEEHFISGKVLEWNQWYKPPDEIPGMTLLKIQLEKNFSGKLKSFFYKDNLYTIYIKTSGGEIFAQRLIPSRAKEGIWIDPIILDPFRSKDSQGVEAIMVCTSEPGFVKKGVKAEFFSIGIGTETLRRFFLKDSSKKFCLYRSSLNNFDTRVPGWESAGSRRDSMESFSGHFSEVIDPGKFSSTLIMEADSLGEGHFELRASVWVKPEWNPKSILVISLVKDGKSKVWKYVHVSEQMTGTSQWSMIRTRLEFENLKGEYDQVKVFLLNNGRKPLTYDDFEVRSERIDSP